MRRSDQPSRPSAMTCSLFPSLKTFSKRGCQEKNLPDGLKASRCSTASSPPATVRVSSGHGEYFAIQPFPSYEEAFSERPGAVKGAPAGAAKRTLEGEDRSEIFEEEGKQILDSESISETRQARRIALSCVNHGSI